MRGAVVRWVDPLVLLIVGALLLGLLLPVHGAAADVLDQVRTGAVVLLFFLYGARLHTTEVRAGLRNWRLQGSMLVATYVVFPLLGLAVQLLPDAVLSPDLRTGMLFLSVLPSTVQSSVVFTSIARGNVAGAITGATVSNVLGIVLTPLMVGLLLGRAGVSAGGSLGATLLQLLAPFAAGQVAERWIGGWVRAHPHLLRFSDRATLLLVAYTSVSQAQVSGAWSHVTWGVLAALAGVCAVLLALMLALTWRAGAALALPYPDRVALLMCGSKKSLATGLPMASVLFSPVVAASVALPVVVFHQLQLATCAVVARRLADRTAPGV
ncbi:bile acid:sodium symporter family protein [Cellulomonas soli]|uniref:bile acid:sodium symporter family protein n=1 Tax=Cellulomonas soli TaxID=931535 RepID=UPI003F8395B9